MILLLTAWIGGGPLFSQEYNVKVEHYGVEQGLTHRQANCIFQDKRGFMWIGTANGLNRFDGYTFKQFTKQKDGLCFNGIVRIIQDVDGWLWLISMDSKKICLFHPETNEVVSFEDRFKNDPVAPLCETADGGVLTDQDGSLWFFIASENSLVRYHPAEGFRLIRIKDQPALIFLYGFSDHNTIWALKQPMNLVVEMDKQGNVLRRFDYGIPMVPWLGPVSSSHYLISKQPVSSRTVFLMNGKGEISPVENKWFTNPLPDIILPLDDTGLILTERTLIDPRRGVVAEWELPFRQKINRYWLCVMRDRSGKYWFCDDFGFYVIKITRSHFKRYLYEKGVNSSGKSIRGLVVADNRIFANVESNGCFAIDPQTGAASPIPGVSAEWGHFGMNPAKNGDVLSAGSRKVYRLNPRTGIVAEYAFKHDIWSVMEDHAGTVWFGSTSGLFYCKSGETTPVHFDRVNRFDKINNCFIIFLQEDRFGKYWACTTNGLYQFDPGKGVLAHFWSGADKSLYLPADNFTHFYVDAEGIFWIGTNVGLIRVPSRPDGSGGIWPDWQSGEGKLYTRNDGFSNDVIYAVYEDRQGWLWMPSDLGIMRMNKRSGLIKTYLEADGISNQEFNRTSHFQDERGFLYFGGLNGVTAFNPADFDAPTDTMTRYPLEISAFHQFVGRTSKLEDRSRELVKTRNIYLLPGDRIFDLELAMLHYDEVNLVQFAWKIDGLDNTWHYQKDRHFNFGGLPYGTFNMTFRAQASNGVWSKNELVLTVHVLKPWYLQTWFLLLVSLLTLGGIWYYNRWKNRMHLVEQKRLEKLVLKATERIEQDKRTIEQQAEELRQLDKIKSNFFANVSHELRTPLALLLGPLGTVLKRKRIENQDFTLVKLAQVHARQLLQLVNQILDLSKLDSGKLELHEFPVRLYTTLRRLVAAFESHAEQKGIRFVFQSEIDQNLRVELDEPKLETILNNLLSNALKFTGSGGKITVLAESLGNRIRITVSDTGRGIHPADLNHIFNRFYQSSQPNAATEGGTGIGLALCRELAELMQGSIRADSEGPEKGSRFVLELPLKEVLGRSTDPEPEEEIETDSPKLVAMPEPLKTASAETLLIVEDNTSLRDYLKMILSGEYRVLTAENGSVAINLLNELMSRKASDQPVPQLIVSDIMMPGMDGFQLLEYLKNDDRLRHIPVIMLTARADMEDKLRALRIGVDDYLTKPFEEEELLARVENLLTHQKNRMGIEETPEEPVQQLSQANAEWLADMEAWTLDHLNNSLLSVSEMARKAALSERQLQRRLREVTGLSPQQYIAELRLQKARAALEKGAFRTVAEVAYDAGLSDPKAFSRSYRERFGRLPSSYFQ